MQERLYFLLDQLQKMSKEVPSSLQQRLPYELLSDLAASLAQVGLFVIKMLVRRLVRVRRQIFLQFIV